MLIDVVRLRQASAALGPLVGTLASDQLVMLFHSVGSLLVGSPLLGQRNHVGNVGGLDRFAMLFLVDDTDVDPFGGHIRQAVE